MFQIFRSTMRTYAFIVIFNKEHYKLLMFQKKKKKLDQFAVLICSVKID